MKFIFFIFSGLNSLFRGKNNVNNHVDFFNFLYLITSRKTYSLKYFGEVIKFDPRKSSVASRLFLENSFEDQEINLILKMVPEEGVILDIGANIGLYSRILASKRPKAKVFSFEPSTEPYKYLLINANLSNNIIFNIGLSDKSGIYSFYEYEDDALSSFMPSNRSKLKKISNYSSVNGFELLQLLNQANNIILIKIDVEGFEQEVINGLKPIIESQHPLMMIELIFNEQSIYLFGYLIEIGYQAFYVKENELFQTNDLHKSYYNYIFVKN